MTRLMGLRGGPNEEIIKPKNGIHYLGARSRETEISAKPEFPVFLCHRHWARLFRSHRIGASVAPAAEPCFLKPNFLILNKKNDSRFLENKMCVQ